MGLVGIRSCLGDNGNPSESQPCSSSYSSSSSSSEEEEDGKDEATVESASDMFLRVSIVVVVDRSTLKEA